MPDGLQTTKMVEDDRIELSTLRCKRSVFPLALIPQIRRGLSFMSTLTTRLLSVMPPRNTTYSVRPHMTGTVIPIRTNPLTAAMFSVSYLTVRCNIEGRTQSMAGVVGIEPTTE